MYPTTLALLRDDAPCERLASEPTAAVSEDGETVVGFLDPNQHKSLPKERERALELAK